MDRFPGALDNFVKELAGSKHVNDLMGQSEYWTQYGQWTRVNSDRGDTIARRHRFYMRKMYEYLQPLHAKDPKRLFGEVERTILFYTQNKQCAVCGGNVEWHHCEVHHVAEHSAGGPTILDNGALVHKVCHPKGEVDTAAFAAKFAATKAAGGNKPTQI
jgi:hypothetical protein